MPIPAIRTKQTTSTTGTGTLTLIAAAADMRSFNAAFGGSSVVVRYVLQRSTSSVYEIGYGTFNGGSPGTLTRDTVIASSNAGALVSLTAGTTDVFVDFMPGERRNYAISTTTTLALADIGNFIRCTPSADMDVDLPAAATVPPGASYLVRNEGTNNAIVWIDPNGAEGIDGNTASFPLFTGECAEFFSVSTAWRFGVRPTGWRFVARSSASSSASVDFILPTWGNVGRAEYELLFRNVRPATDGSYLQLRLDDAGGASFDAGASDYQHGLIYVSGAATVSGNGAAASAIRLTPDIDSTATGNQASGRLVLNPGAIAARNPTVYGMSMVNGNGGIYAGAQPWIVGGQRLSAMDANAVRFMMDTGNITIGDFDLFAKFD